MRTMPDERAIEVLIVDDSPFVRKALQRMFEAEPCIHVVGVARDGREGIEKIGALNPDVVILDIMMPEMDGIEVLKAVMETHPVPVLMFSQFTKEGADLTLKALDLGAMDFVDKSSTGYMDFFNLSHELISKIKAIAGSRPVKVSEYAEGVELAKGNGLVDVVSIGTSTGGPPALQMVLTKFPRDITFGLLIVQHMPKGFTGPLSMRLDGMCEIHVKEAEDGDRIEPGLALVAPSGLHLKVVRGGERVRLDLEPLTTMHRPSVDVLFRSVAEGFGSRSMGVLLTGMGSDGAKGMKAIKEKGGVTLAQDEATSVIFGMPRVAIDSGVVDSVAPITRMAEEILRRA